MVYRIYIYIYVYVYIYIYIYIYICAPGRLRIAINLDSQEGYRRFENQGAYIASQLGLHLTMMVVSSCFEVYVKRQVWLDA